MGLDFHCKELFIKNIDRDFSINPKMTIEIGAKFMSNSIFDKFTNQYSVNKTLRFRLIPVSGTKSPHSGQVDLCGPSDSTTSQYIKEKQLLQKDEDLADKYQKAKKVIDEYHKDYIDEKLSGFSFKEDDLQAFADFYNQLKKNDRNSC